MPRPSPSPFPTNRPNFFVEPSTTIESLRNSSTRCEPLASRCSSTPSKDPLVEKEEYHPKCALSSRHSDQPTTVIHILDPHSPIAEAHRSYLLELSVKTLLIIPLSSGGQVNGRLDFRFNEERNFDAEELEIVRALATQASLAIQLTRLAKTARQSAVLEERNRLAGEIHDTLAQSFAGISMQLE